MKRITEKLIRGILFAVLFIIIYTMASDLLQSFKVRYRAVPYYILTCFYPLLIAALLLFEHIRDWFRGGRFHVDWEYLILPAILLIPYIPGRIPEIPVLGWFFIYSAYNPLSFLVFWYCLIKAFRREKPA